MTEHSRTVWSVERETAMAREDREARLPSWARQLIGSLRLLVTRLESERDAARFATNPDESDTLIDFYTDPPVGIGRGTAVRFRLDREREYVDVRNVDGEVRVSSGDRLVLRLEASNVLRITVER